MTSDDVALLVITFPILTVAVPPDLVLPTILTSSPIAYPEPPSFIEIPVISRLLPAVKFILESPSMTGQLITVDAGQHLGWAQPGQRIPDEE